MTLFCCIEKDACLRKRRGWSCQPYKQRQPTMWQLYQNLIGLGLWRSGTARHCYDETQPQFLLEEEKSLNLQLWPWADKPCNTWRNNNLLLLTFLYCYYGDRHLSVWYTTTDPRHYQNRAGCKQADRHACGQNRWWRGVLEEPNRHLI